MHQGLNYAMTASPPPAQPPSQNRVDAYDLLRGISAFAVICIHAFPILLTGYARSSVAWTMSVVLNTISLFAVPAFLLITSLLVTKSFLRRPNLRDFYGKRLSTTLWPYALWTTLLLARAWRSNRHFRWDEAAFRIVSGKSYEYLYFLGILLQLYLVLPFLILLVRKIPTARAMLIALVATTLLVYALNRSVVHYPYVGSVFLWHTPSVLLGIWLGCQGERSGDILKEWTRAALAIALLALCCYVPLTVGVMNNAHVNTLAYQVSEWAYTTGMALFLLCLCLGLPAQFRGKPTLLHWGRNSMALYLLHYFPCVLLPPHLLRFHLPPILLFVLDVLFALSVPLAIVRVIKGTKLEVFLLGRN